MTYLPILLYGAFVVGLTALLYWALRERVRPWLLVALPIIWGAHLISGFYLEGRPRPAILLSGEVEVVAYQISDGEHIDLWVRDGDLRFYRMPWRDSAARQLHEAAKKAGKHGSVFYKDHEGELMFHPRPPAPSPLKQ